MKVDRYILEKSVIDGKEEVSLARIVMHEGKGLKGEEYYDGRWHPFDGALSYMHDPSPGDFITEQEAIEVMKLIDQAD